MDHSDLPFLSGESSNKDEVRPGFQGNGMDVQTLLEKYGLSRETTARYIEAITRFNQSDTAEEIGVSRDTVNRYKRAFKQMAASERTFLIAALGQAKLFEEITEGGE